MERDSKIFTITNICDFCFKKCNKIGEGGNSCVYIDKNNKFCIRTIPFTKWKSVKNEILASNFVTELVKEICPHFPITYSFSMCKKENSIHQTLEKFDGDISKMKELNNIDYIQILMSIFCLMRKGYRHNDVKKNNILYRKLDKPIKMFYKFKNEFYELLIERLCVLSDFGKLKKYPELANKFEIEAWGNAKDTFCLMDIFNKPYRDHIKEVNSFTKGYNLTENLLTHELLKYKVKSIHHNYYDLDKELPEPSSHGLYKCFEEKMNVILNYL